MNGEKVTPEFIAIIEAFIPAGLMLVDFRQPIIGETIIDGGRKIRTVAADYKEHRLILAPYAPPTEADLLRRRAVAAENELKRMRQELDDLRKTTGAADPADAGVTELERNTKQ